MLRCIDSRKKVERRYSFIERLITSSQILKRPAAPKLPRAVVLLISRATKEAGSLSRRQWSWGRPPDLAAISARALRFGHHVEPPLGALLELA